MTKPGGKSDLFSRIVRFDSRNYYHNFGTNHYKFISDVFSEFQRFPVIFLNFSDIFCEKL